jgi:hypothetical protein
VPRRGCGKQEYPMKEVALSEVKDDLSKYLRLAERETVVIACYALVLRRHSFARLPQAAQDRESDCPVVLVTP